MYPKTAKAYIESSRQMRRPSEVRGQYSQPDFTMTMTDPNTVRAAQLYQDTARGLAMILEKQDVTETDVATEVEYTIPKGPEKVLHALQRHHARLDPRG